MAQDSRDRDHTDRGCWIRRTSRASKPGHSASILWTCSAGLWALCRHAASVCATVEATALPNNMRSRFRGAGACRMLQGLASRRAGLTLTWLRQLGDRIGLKVDQGRAFGDFGRQNSSVRINECCRDERLPHLVSSDAHVSQHDYMKQVEETYSRNLLGRTHFYVPMCSGLEARKSSVEATKSDNSQKRLYHRTFVVRGPRRLINWMRVRVAGPIWWSHECLSAERRRVVLTTPARPHQARPSLSRGLHFTL